jgi:DNA topoisomerase IA
MARVYDLVVRHFIASVSKDAVWQSTAIEFEVDVLGDKGKFSLRGKEVRSLLICRGALSLFSR